MKLLSRYLDAVDDSLYHTIDAINIRKDLDVYAKYVTSIKAELIRADVDIRMKDYQKNLEK